MCRTRFQLRSISSEKKGCGQQPENAQTLETSAGLAASAVISLAFLPALIAGCNHWKTYPTGTAEKVSSDDPRIASHAAEQLERGKTAASSPPASRSEANPHSNDERENHFLLGRQAEDAGQLLQAQKHYQQVVRQSPKHAHAHHRLGVVADKLQHYAAAKRHYETALNYLAPNNHSERSIVLSDLGYSHLLQGNFPSSEQALASALESNEHNLIAWRNLGLLHGYRGDYQRAFDAFSHAGGEQDAYAKLDRLFPQWRSQATDNIADTSTTNSDKTPQPAVTGHDGNSEPIQQTAAVETPSPANNEASAKFSIQQHKAAPFESASSIAFPHRNGPASNQFPTSAQLNLQTKQADPHQFPPGSRSVAAANGVSLQQTKPAGIMPAPNVSIPLTDSIRAPRPARSANPAVGETVAGKSSETVQNHNQERIVDIPRQNQLHKPPHVQPPTESVAPISAPPEHANMRQPNSVLQAKSQLEARKGALMLGTAVGPGILFAAPDVSDLAASQNGQAEPPITHAEGLIQQISGERPGHPSAADSMEEFEAAVQLHREKLRKRQELQQMLER